MPEKKAFQQQAVHGALEQQQPKPQSGPILCQNCGQACKGEVLRVQNKHFHIKCFICKGNESHDASVRGRGTLTLPNAPQ
ncbi:hypothetical protein PGIGA_G00040550 [Pangasianodon gigas]|uniref:Uncharacterized protein n=1 Tax=Pangasianodon gigas TaxID=30993 RepID=A0ACC5X0B4_PANGG|nr:hypothetical protein [Pangasianodon gigas]